MSSDVSPRELLKRQIELIGTGDLEGLMQQYREDAALVRFDRVAAGVDEIRTLLTAYLSQSPAVQGLDALAETEDTLSYQATMTIGGKTVRTYGAWVLKEGKIWRQVTGLLG